MSDPTASTNVKNAVLKTFGTFPGGLTMVDDSWDIQKFIADMTTNISQDLNMQIKIEQLNDSTQKLGLIDRRQGIEPDLDNTPPTLEALGVKDGDQLELFVK